MALRSRRFVPSPTESQQNAGLGVDEPCNSLEKGTQICPGLLQLQDFHKHKATVRERLHGFALCWGPQEKREVKLREMRPQLHDSFEDCERNTVDEAKEEEHESEGQYQVKEAGTDRFAHIHVEDVMAAKNHVVISDIA